MKILFTNHTGEISGAEHSLLDLLKGLRISRLDTLLVCGDDGPLAERARALGIETELIRPFTAGFTRSPLQLSRYCGKLRDSARQVGLIARARKPDLVHANSVRAGLVACLAQRSYRAPLVVHIRDCVPQNILGALSRRLIVHHAAAIIANSEHTLQSFAGGSVRIRDKSCVVCNAVDLERFDPRKSDTAPLRQELALEGAFPVLALVGQITPWKGQVDAIDAMTHIRCSYPRAKLLIVGEAKFQRHGARYNNVSYASELRELVKDRELDAHVLFIGERNDIPAVFKTCDLALLPSWEEPFGRTVIEAMAMGKPVVATEVGGPREIIEEGVTGRLVPPRNPNALAEAVCQLAGNSALRESMGIAGRRRVVERFSLDAHVAQLLSIYSSLLRIADRGLQIDIQNQKSKLRNPKSA